MRIVSTIEDARGCAIVDFPWFNGWRIGVVVLEPFIGGWHQKLFVGCFKRLGG